jgi:hypothetical protein
MQMTMKDIVKEQVPPVAALTAAFVLIVVIGYGVWSSETSGTISIKSPAYETAVVIDTKLAQVIKNPGETFSSQYPEGKHDILVSRGGYWPWQQKVTLSAKETIALSPFFVKKEIIPSTITPEDPEYFNALSLLENNGISGDMGPLVAKTNLKDVRSAVYFPGRTDVLLVAVKDGVYAIDVNNSSPRNFMPIYKGTSPIFVITQNNILYVKDGDSVLRISGIV